MALNLSSYKGTRDLYPEDMRLRNYVFDTWRMVVESFGYQEYAAPMLEPLELYAAKSGQEIVNDQTYKFTDRGDREVAIRPEMTPSIARMVAARRQEMPMPARLFSIANYMRYERPQKGREREFWQLNFDLFGSNQVYADIEILSMSHSLVKAFGATDDMFTVKINDRRLTDFAMKDFLGLDDIQSLAMVKLFDRRDKISQESFSDQVAEIAPDNAEQISSKVDQLLRVKSIDDLPVEIANDAVTKPLKDTLDILASRGITNAKFAPDLMRGFDYYTGIVFEIFDEAPENRRAMFGGGRYDGLIGLFGVEDLPVVGAAPGETMFIEFLKAHNLIPDLNNGVDVAVIPFIDAGEIADQLRSAGLNVAIDFTDRKTDKKIKAAVKAGIRYAIFVGEDELESGKYPLKNLVTGEETKLEIEQIVATVSKSRLYLL